MHKESRDGAVAMLDARCRCRGRGKLQLVFPIKQQAREELEPLLSGRAGTKAVSTVWNVVTADPQSAASGDAA